jgi:hypothetical protein
VGPEGSLDSARTDKSLRAVSPPAKVIPNSSDFVVHYQSVSLADSATYRIARLAVPLRILLSERVPTDDY